MPERSDDAARYRQTGRPVDTAKRLGIDTCVGCRHLSVTWDPARPYGCRAMGFKSAHSPHVVVRDSSGLPCQSAEPRRSPRPSGPAAAG